MAVPRYNQDNYGDPDAQRRAIQEQLEGPLPNEQQYVDDGTGLRTDGAPGSGSDPIGGYEPPGEMEQMPVVTDGYPGVLPDGETAVPAPGTPGPVPNPNPYVAPTSTSTSNGTVTSNSTSTTTTTTPPLRPPVVVNPPAIPAPTPGNTYPTSVSPLVAEDSRVLAPETSDQVRRAIFDQITALQTPTDANSATIRAQTEGYDLQSRRGLEETRNSLAEAAYASGNLDAGGYETQQQLAGERAAADRAGFQGAAIGQAETQRRANLMQALGQGAQYEQQDNSLAQQASEFSRTQAQSQQQFDQAMSQRSSEFAATMGLNYDQLNASDRQFIDSLAWAQTRAGQEDATTRYGIDTNAGLARGGQALTARQLGQNELMDTVGTQQWALLNTPEMRAYREAIAAQLAARVGS